MAADPAGFRCSTAAGLRGDSLLGTASPAEGWVLVENNGPWPRRAFADSPLDPVAARAIMRRASQARLRPLFIRRHGRRGGSDLGRFAIVDSLTERVGWETFEHLADVADAPWDAPAAGTEPIYLVCAHGRHDRCCAIAGRPVAARFAELRHTETWECSHVGGDRFAGNVVVLPWGLYYGTVTPQSVAQIIEATERHQIVPELLRGRSTESAPVQAARVETQRRTGLLGIPDARPLRCDAIGQGRWDVELEVAGEPTSVTVVERRVADARATCSHRAAVPMREFQVLPPPA